MAERKGLAPHLHALRKSSLAGSSASWGIDYDYLDQLSPAEQQWLNDFTNELYLSSSKAIVHSPEQLRECWCRHKQATRDVYGRGHRVYPKGATDPDSTRRRRDNDDLDFDLRDPMGGKDAVEDALIELIDSDALKFGFSPGNASVRDLPAEKAPKKPISGKKAPKKPRKSPRKP